MYTFLYEVNEEKIEILRSKHKLKSEPKQTINNNQTVFYLFIYFKFAIFDISCF